jgi:hypothetical protein
MARQNARCARCAPPLRVPRADRRSHAAGRLLPARLLGARGAPSCAPCASPRLLQPSLHHRGRAIRESVSHLPPRGHHTRARCGDSWSRRACPQAFSGARARACVRPHDAPPRREELDEGGLARAEHCEGWEEGVGAGGVRRSAGCLVTTAGGGAETRARTYPRRQSSYR